LVSEGNSWASSRSNGELVADKKLLVLGATGGTGQHVVTQALQRGCAVTAFVRDPARLKIESDRLRVHTGDVIGEDAHLVAAMRGQDAVISVLGVGGSFRSRNVIGQAIPRILRSMETAGVRRLVFTSAFGVGDTHRDVPPIPRLFIRTLLRDVYRDKAAGEEALHRSLLDWTIVYPTRLVDRAATGQYRVGERLALRGFPAIARADLAEFLLAQVDEAKYVRKGVLVSS
jgi:putative NADH-flavin reductase